jgi:tetratricopeptide (TPR) repeat protein
LRILVAISSPDREGGMLLDYERELRNVLSAVRAARGGDAQVRVVQFATTAEIRAALDAEPAHVLHVSCHGNPGVLELEHADGSPRDVDAKTFVDEAIPPGRMPSVIALAACHTNTRPDFGEPSFAPQLMARGAAVVIASETAVSDVFAVEVFARAYGRLAEAAAPDAVAAFCDARREAQLQLAAAPDVRRQAVADLAEWASLSVLSSAGQVWIFDPAVSDPVAAPAPRLAIAHATPRPVGTFVGRRTELRRWPRQLLADERCGLVLHGIGGVGKTALATELVARVVEHAPDRVAAIVHGQLRVASLIDAIVDAALRRLLGQRRLHGDAARALELAANSQEPWSRRLAVLREHVFEALPLLVVLDNFEDNLERLDGAARVSGELAEVLAAIARDPGALRLLITSRFAFTLPGGAERWLDFAALGALSQAETRKLVWALPGLDRLAEREVEQIWRLVGGHPRSLEYVDALLSGGRGRFADIDHRLRQAIGRRMDDDDTTALLGAEWKLDAAVAEVATIAADDVLLDELLVGLDEVLGARALVVGASVYREPIDDNALLFQCGSIDITAPAVVQRASTIAGMSSDAGRALMARPSGPDEADGTTPPRPPRIAPRNYDVMIEAAVQSSLLSAHAGSAEDERRLFVHRWTASELERRIHGDGPGGPLREAHRRAAQYWRWRADVWPQDRAGRLHDVLEARQHLIAAGDMTRVGELTSLACVVLDGVGRWPEEAILLRDTLALLPPGSGWRGPYLQRLGNLAYRRGDLAEADRLYDEALAILEPTRSPDAIAAVHHQRGLLAGRRGQLADAERWFQGVIEMAVEHPDDVDPSASMSELGSLALDRGDLARAERCFADALALLERRGEELRSATIVHQLGITAMLRGDVAVASEHHARAHEIRLRHDDQDGLASSEFQLGSMAYERGDYLAAERHYTASLELEERLGRVAGVAGSLGSLGMVARECGEFDDAEHHFQRALEIFEQLRDQHGIANSHHELGLLARERGQLDVAEEHCRHARGIFEVLDDQAALGTSHHELATIALERGDLGAAERSYRAALAINDAISHSALGAGNRYMLGVVAHRRGDARAARAAYLESLELFTRLEMRADSGRALSQLGRLANDGGDRAGAVGWHAHALLARLLISGDHGLYDAEALIALRATLGERRFRRVLGKEIANDLRVRSVLAVLDTRTRALEDA